MTRQVREWPAWWESATAGLVVDYSQAGAPIGIEIVSPAFAQLAEVNKLLAELGAEPLSEVEWAPLAATSRISNSDCLNGLKPASAN